MDEKHERALLERIRQTTASARENALSELLDELQPQIHGLCFRLTGNDADAEDATQDTLLAMYRGMEHFRGDSRVSTWAYRIAVRSATKVRAREHKHTVANQSVDDVAGSVTCGASQKDLRRALASLPVMHATVLALFAMDGMTHKEIAETLNVPQGTVWSRLHTARKKLVQAIDRPNA